MTSLSMVGHSADLSELTRAWSAGDRRRGRTAVITGAAGLGKSRLITAALDRFDPRPVTILTGAARLHSPAPYDWLAAVLDRTGMPGQSKIRVPADALAWLAQDPDVPRERYAPDALLRIAVRVVRALVGEGPAVLVAEDLDALDPASLNLLAALASAPDLPALLLVTSRPPTVDDAGQIDEAERLVARTLARLTGAAGAVRVHLRPLSRPDVAAALTQVYAPDLVTEPVITAAVRRSEGNPYRLTELLADLGGRDPIALLAGHDAANDAIDGARAEPAPAAQLTARERDVLACLAAGMANKHIARRLGISIRTVTVHVSNLLRKTGTASRVDAALWAVRHDVNPALADAVESVDAAESADAAEPAGSVAPAEPSAQPTASNLEPEPAFVG